MDFVQLREAQEWGILLACLMMCADVLVGFVGAVINNDISSTKMRKGLLHKVLMLILIFVCLFIEVATTHMFKLPYDIPTCEVVCGYVVMMELASVIENIGKAYPAFADSPVARLFDMEDKEDKEGADDDA